MSDSHIHTGPSLSLSLYKRRGGGGNGYVHFWFTSTKRNIFTDISGLVGMYICSISCDDHCQEITTKNSIYILHPLYCRTKHNYYCNIEYKLQILWSKLYIHKLHIGKLKMLWLYGQINYVQLYNNGAIPRSNPGHFWL